VTREAKTAQVTAQDEADELAILAAVAGNTQHLAWEHVWRLARLPNGAEVPQKRAASARSRLLARGQIEKDPVYSHGRKEIYCIAAPRSE
jgi:hypothetical protein